jgi:hypothetical protein
MLENIRASRNRTTIELPTVSMRKGDIDQLHGITETQPSSTTRISKKFASQWVAKQGLPCFRTKYSISMKRNG